jgi:hypothetical protein
MPQAEKFESLFTRAAISDFVFHNRGTHRLADLFLHGSGGLGFASVAQY